MADRVTTMRGRPEARPTGGKFYQGVITARNIFLSFKQPNLWYTGAMKAETTTKDDEIREFLDPQVFPDAKHDAWVKAEIERRLAKKARGETTYRSLDAVMVDFGFDAR